MAKISIHQGHHLGKDEAHRRLEKLQAGLKKKYGIEVEWRGDEADIKASKLSGKIVVNEAAVDIDLKLGLALSVLQGRIRSALAEEVHRALA
jgi:putative polyhydroxyalkanoate system protein